MTVSLNKDELAKLKNIIDMGVSNKLSVKDLNDSMREAVNELSQEIDVPKKIINDSIRVAFKAQIAGSVKTVIDESQDSLDEVDNLLQQVGRK